MKNTGSILKIATGLALCIVIGALVLRRGAMPRTYDDSEGTAQGYVFLDRNGNGLRDRGERGLAGVCVSDQRSVVETDRRGHWRLPAHDEAVYFVTKPHGYATPLNEHNLPQFYYLHKATPELDLAGPVQSHTGPLPASIDFPLIRQEEPDRFTAIVMGDPQPRDLTEVNYLAHDVLEELVGTKALFVLTLGDLTFDNLSLYPALNQAYGKIGVPIYQVLGDHDAN